MTPNRRRPLTFIPDFLPDQTLYSWVSQYHEASGNAYPTISMEQLFWSTQAGWNFHIPSHLDNFCASTRRIFGEPDDLIDQRTTLPAYLWHRPESIRSNVIARLRSASTAGIPQQLGMWKQPDRSSQPRQLCSECAAEDTSTYGSAYWHRTHQLPGVAVCIRHQRPLLSTNANEENKQRGHFFTPNADIAVQHLTLTPVSNSQALDQLLAIAEIAEQLIANNKTVSTKLLQVHSCILQRLEETGFPALNDPQTAYPLADRHYQAHLALLQENLWPHTPSAGGSSRLLGSLMLNSSVAVHSVEYALLIQWLFTTWNDFDHVMRVQK